MTIGHKRMYALGTHSHTHTYTQTHTHARYTRLTKHTFEIIKVKNTVVLDGLLPRYVFVITTNCV